MNILVTGGSGLIGTALVAHLRERRHNVRVLTQHNTGNPDEYEWNYMDGTIDEKVFDNLDSIIHLAGAPIAQRWTKAYKEVVIRSRVDSIGFLLQKCNEMNIRLKAFVSASGVNGYGTFNSDKILTETDGILRNDFLAEVCKKWEDAANSFSKVAERVVILRTAAVLAKNGGAFLELNTLAERNLASGIGSGKQWFNWIHLEDMVRMYTEAVENPNLNGAYNAVADEVVTNKNFMKRLAKANKKFFMPLNVPALMIKMALGEMSEMLLKGSRVSNKKIKSAGFDFNFPDLDGALKDLV